MIIHTVLGNSAHPEYGVASIPFPISADEYLRLIEMLRAIEVGDVLKPDCHIAEIESPLPVLKCLEDTDINVDKLDYLAKRLDSLSDHELQQFQAMAAKNGYCKIKDLINLTFSCQTVTVVSDFSDLEAIGRQHFMNTHCGVTPSELAQQKLRRIALDLLKNDLSAKITPYGVVYENDFWLDEVYDGEKSIEYKYPRLTRTHTVLTGGNTPMPLQSPCQYTKYCLRAFHCLIAFPLRQNCFAPDSEGFSSDFCFLRRRCVVTHQGEKGKKRRKDSL